MSIDKKIATRQSYGEALKELGKENKDIVVLDADLSSATKTNIFAKEFPERFFDMGISEQDMIGTAAGFATCGKIPYASTFAMFAAGRAYDQIRNSVCYPNLNVKICATHAGITVGEDGATHQMLEDISLMRSIPNMTVISTSDDVQTKWAVKEISKINGPCYLRLSRLATPIVYEENQRFEIGKGVYILLGTHIMPYTKIGNFVMISMGVNVAHHSILHEGSFLSTGVNFGASIIAHKYAYIGISSTIMTGVHELGENCLIGAGAVVIKDVPTNAVMAGIPAKVLKYRE